MKTANLITSLLLFGALGLRAQVVNPGGSGGNAGVVVGATLPATCTVTQQYQVTTSGATKGLNVCTATNTWTLIGPNAASAGGSTTQLQFNNATALGGISQFITNGTTTITGSSTSVLDMSAAGAVLKSNSF